MSIHGRGVKKADVAKTGRNFGRYKNRVGVSKYSKEKKKGRREKDIFFHTPSLLREATGAKHAKS